MKRTGERPLGARKPPNFSSPPASTTHTGRTSPTSQARLKNVNTTDRFNASPASNTKSPSSKKVASDKVKKYLSSLETARPVLKHKSSAGSISSINSLNTIGKALESCPNIPVQSHSPQPKVVSPVREIASIKSASPSNSRARKPASPKSTRVSSQVSLLSAKFESADGPIPTPPSPNPNRVNSSPNRKNDSLSWISPAPESPLKVKPPPSPPFAKAQSDVKQITPTKPGVHRKPVTRRPASPLLIHEKSDFKFADTSPLAIRPASPTRSKKQIAPQSPNSDVRSTSPTPAGSLSPKVRPFTPTPFPRSPVRKQVGSTSNELFMPHSPSAYDTLPSSTTESRADTVGSRSSRELIDKDSHSQSKDEKARNQSPSKVSNERRLYLEDRSPSPRTRHRVADLRSPPESPSRSSSPIAYAKSHVSSKIETSGRIMPPPFDSNEARPHSRNQGSQPLTRLPTSESDLTRSPSAASAFSWMTADERELTRPTREPIYYQAGRHVESSRLSPSSASRSPERQTTLVPRSHKIPDSTPPSRNKSETEGESLLSASPVVKHTANKLLKNDQQSPQSLIKTIATPVSVSKTHTMITKSSSARSCNMPSEDSNIRNAKHNSTFDTFTSGNSSTVSDSVSDLPSLKGKSTLAARSATDIGVQNNATSLPRCESPGHVGIRSSSPIRRPVPIASARSPELTQTSKPNASDYSIPASNSPIKTISSPRPRSPDREVEQTSHMHNVISPSSSRSPTLKQIPRESPKTGSQCQRMILPTGDDSIPYTPQFEKSFSMFNTEYIEALQTEGSTQASNSFPQTIPERSERESIASSEHSDSSNVTVRRHPSVYSTEPSSSVVTPQGSPTAIRARTVRLDNSPTRHNSNFSDRSLDVSRNLARQPTMSSNHSVRVLARSPSPKLGKTPRLPPPSASYEIVSYPESGTFCHYGSVRDENDTDDETNRKNELSRYNSVASRATRSSYATALEEEEERNFSEAHKSESRPLKDEDRAPSTSSSLSYYTSYSNETISRGSVSSKAETVHGDDWGYSSQSSVMSRAQSIMSAASEDSGRSFSGSSGMSVGTIQTNITTPSSRSSPILDAGEFKAMPAPQTPEEEEPNSLPQPVTPHVAHQPPQQRKARFEIPCKAEPKERYYELDMNNMPPEITATTRQKESTSAFEKLLHDKLLQDIFICYIFAIFIIA